MTQSDPRVAVYFDFDNIVISRYNLLHGKGAFHRDTSRTGEQSDEALERLRQSHLDIDAVLDYATTFGSLALCRAYADWSHPVNAKYRQDLTARAVDLVQLFPLSGWRKNGADIRLAVDAMDDLYLLPDVTHVVIVAGDSDYVPLAQKVRRLGRYVVGIGVTGGTSRALTAACDEFADYGSLLTDGDDDGDDDEVDGIVPVAASLEQQRGEKQVSEKDRAGGAAHAAPKKTADHQTPSTKGTADPSAADPSDADEDDEVVEPESGRLLARRRPGPLLRKALLLLETKNDQEWQAASEVKNQMLRMDPSFQEREFGSATFTEFVKSYPGIAEIDEDGHNRVRKRPGSH